MADQWLTPSWPVMANNCWWKMADWGRSAIVRTSFSKNPRDTLHQQMLVGDIIRNRDTAHISTMTIQPRQGIDWWENVQETIFLDDKPLNFTGSCSWKIVKNQHRSSAENSCLIKGASTTLLYTIFRPDGRKVAWKCQRESTGRLQTIHNGYGLVLLDGCPTL